MKLLFLSKSLLLASLAISSACTHQLYYAPLVSMTRTDTPKNAKLKDLGDVKASFCPRDEPVSKQKMTGIIDEAILKAQHQKKADYLTDVKFVENVWNGCIEVQGRAAKLP